MDHHGRAPSCVSHCQGPSPTCRQRDAERSSGRIVWTRTGMGGSSDRSDGCRRHLFPLPGQGGSGMPNSRRPGPRARAGSGPVSGSEPTDSSSVEARIGSETHPADAALIDLVRAAHSGSDPALREILRRFSPLIGRLSAQMPCPRGEGRHLLETELAIAITKSPPRCAKREPCSPRPPPSE